MDGIMLLFIVVVMVIVALVILATCVVITRQKRVKVLETFGKFSGVRHAGFTFKWPTPIQIVVDEVDLRITELVEEIRIKSKDNAFMDVPVKVQIQVMPERVEQAYYSLNNPMQQIGSYIVNQIRSKASGMTMDEIFSGRSDFEEAVEQELKSTFERYGYEVVNVLVDDPQPSKDLRIAFEKVLAAQRDKEAAILEKDAIRERTVGVAEAEAESLRVKAVAYADQRKTMAEGNGEAIKLFCDGLQVTHKDALKFFEGWDVRDAVRDAARGDGNTVLIPVDMGGSDLADIAAKIKALESVK